MVDGADVVCMEAFTVGSNGIWLNESPLKASFPLLMIQMGIIILTFNCIHRFIGRRLHQPTIVSQILAGILLGPSCLGRVKYLKSVLYPAQNWVPFSTIGNIGLMFIMFILGLRTDVSIIRGIGKRDAAVAVIGQAASVLTIVLFYFFTRHKTFGKSFALTDYDSATEGGKFLYLVPAIAIRWSLSSYLVILFLLEELNLLNSKLGRMSNSITLFGHMVHLVWSNVLVSAIQSKNAATSTMGIAAFAGFAALIAFILFVARPLVLWIIKRTKDRNRAVVDAAYVDVVLVLTLASGLFSEVTGHSADTGTFLLGLALPSGAPLGSTFVERLGTMIHGFGAPVFVASVIFNADISLAIGNGFGMTTESSTALLLLALSVLGKFLGVFLPLLFLCKLAIKDASVVSLILSARGLYEIKTIQSWRAYGIADEVTSGVTIVVILVFTAMTTPLIKALYKPSTAYTTNRRRTVQHTKHDSELRLLACIHNQDNVPSVINLLEDFELKTINSGGGGGGGGGRNCELASEGSTTVFVLHLIELVGKAASFLAPYRESSSSSSTSTKPSASETGHIVNAFRYLERSNPCSISIQPFVSNSPYASVHQDICTLALEKKVAMVILPFHKKMAIDGRHMESVNHAFRTLNAKVLALAPCSVGILVDHGISENSAATVSLVLSHHQHLLLHNIAVYFIGGPDDREALAFALRVLRNTEIAVTLVRFLPPIQWRHQDRDELLDEEIIKEFKLNSMRRSMRKRAIYREEVVKDGAAMVAIIRHISHDFNLLIVGRGEGRETKLMVGLSAWSEFPELGIIGDMLASPEFGSTTEILVVQQQRFGTIKQQQQQQQRETADKNNGGLEKASSCGSRAAPDLYTKES